jgi:hypothetical protein
MGPTRTVVDELHELIADAKRSKARHFFAAKRCRAIEAMLTTFALVINAVLVAHPGVEPDRVRWLSIGAAVCSGFVALRKLGHASSVHWGVGNKFTEIYRDGRLLRARVNVGTLSGAALERAVFDLLKRYHKVCAATAAAPTGFVDRWLGEPRQPA